MFVEITHESGDKTRFECGPSATLTVGWVEKTWNDTGDGSGVAGEIQHSQSVALEGVAGLELVTDKPKVAA